MDYKATVPFTGSVRAAMDVARSQFITNGFRIESNSDRQIVATGPGMHNSRQNPIVGISRAAVTVSNNTIEIDAELGGVRFMRNFLYVFPPALGALLAIVFACIPDFPREKAFLPFLVVLPWLVISPVMAKWLNKRTIMAVDTIAHNMATIGGGTD